MLFMASAVQFWGLTWKEVQQMKIIHLTQRPFIHIECFIKKEVITVYFIHNYLWVYKPINREHFVFLTSMLTSQCKEKKKNKRRRADKNKTEDGLVKRKQTFWLKYYTLGNKHIGSIKNKQQKKPNKTAIFHAVCAPAKSPDGVRGPAQGTKSTRAQDKTGRCAPSEPQLHTRSMQVHNETQSTHGGGGWYYSIKVLALCSCADKTWALNVPSID